MSRPKKGLSYLLNILMQIYSLYLILNTIYICKQYEPETSNAEEKTKIKKEKAKNIQVAFLALNKQGIAGAYALHPGFSYAIKSGTKETLIKAKSYFKS